MNNIVLIGRLTRDVEVRSTASGARVANFTLAVSRRFKGADGVEVDFIDCVAWNKPVDVLEAYTKKDTS